MVGYKEGYRKGVQKGKGRRKGRERRERTWIDWESRWERGEAAGYRRLRECRDG